MLNHVSGDPYSDSQARATRRRRTEWLVSSLALLGVGVSQAVPVFQTDEWLMLGALSITCSLYCAWRAFKQPHPDEQFFPE